MSEFSLYSNRKPTINPAQFNDPIALKTGWDPLTEGGSSVMTHQFRQISPDRAEFDPSVGGCGFAAFIGVLGMFILLIVVGISAVFYLFLSSEEGAAIALAAWAIVPTGIALLLLLGGVGVFWSLFQPIIFDRSKNRFWIGLREPAELDNESSCSINQIHAIQLISDLNKIRFDKHKPSRLYYSHEINLVLESGQRINVMEHGELAQIRTDAKLLGAFLGVPIWDVTADKVLIASSWAP